MSKLPVVPAMFLMLASLLGFDVAATAQKLCPFKAPVGEAGLRKQKATKRVQPLYPEESLKNGISGKVIVEILVDENGKVPEAKVNQAPDELTGQAVVDAAKQWEFKAPPRIQGRQICYSSTLSFRFQIQNGKGKVVDDPIN
jgi:TonB family protein